MMNKKYLALFSIVFLLMLCSYFVPAIPLAKAQPTSNILPEHQSSISFTTSNDSNYNMMVSSSYLAYLKTDSKTTDAVMFKSNGYNLTMNIATSQVTDYNSSLGAIVGLQSPMNPADTVLSRNGSTFLYAGAWTNTNLEFQAFQGELKETLIISGTSKPSSAADYLQYAENVYYNSSLTIYANGVSYYQPSNAKFNTTGIIAFNGPSNVTEFYLPAPYVYDTAGNRTVATYAVTANNGILVIDIRVPLAWINSAVFPVYVDPSTATFSGGTMPTDGSVVSISYDVNMICPDESGYVYIVFVDYSDNVLASTSFFANSNSEYSGSASVTPVQVYAGQSYGLSITCDPQISIVSINSLYVIYYPSYYITVNSAHGSPTASQDVENGNNFPTSVTSPVSGGTGIQYVCTGYEVDGGSLTAGSSYQFTNVQADHTITYYWQEQFYLTVNNGGYGSAGGSGWCNAGSNAQATISPLTVSGGTGTQSVFAGWTGDASGSGSPSNNIYMNAPKTATASWTTQYYITVSSSYGSPTQSSQWVNSGASFNVSVTSPCSTGAGTQEVCTGSTTQTINPVTSPATLTFSWQLQYQVTAASSGIGGDSSGVVVTFQGTAYSQSQLPVSAWIPSGTSCAYSFSSPVASSTGKEYVWQSTSGLSQTGQSSSGFTVSGAGTITGSYGIDYQLTVTGGNSPTGAGWYPSGANVNPSNAWVWGTSGSTRNALINWQLDGNNQNPSRSNTGTFTTPNIAMNAPHTVNFVPTIQYYITISGGNGVTFGTASPTSDQWYDSGTSTTVSSSWVWTIVSGQSRYAIINYAIDSSNQNPTRQYSGTLTTSSVTMNTYHTVSFASTPQYYFSVTDIVDSATGQAWYDTGSSISSSVTTPVAGGTGVQYVPSSWTGTGSLPSGGSLGSSTTGSFTITAYSTCAWNWQTQFWLNTTTNFGSVSPVSGWQNASAVVTLTATSPGVGSGEQYVWSGWAGVGVGSYTGAANPVNVTVNAAFNETATWTHQYQIVGSAGSGGSISPSGTNWVNAGSSPMYTFTPSSNYHILFVSVDGVNYGAPATYTFPNLAAPHTLAVSFTSNSVSLTLAALDQAGGSLLGSTIILNGVAYQTLSGNLTANLVPGSYTGSVTWNGVTVDAFSVQLTQTTTITLTCNAWPYTLNGQTYHVASDRPVASAVWDGTHYTLNFNASATSNTLVFSAGQIPTYITGVAYDLTSDWNLSAGVFTATVSNSTSQASVDFDSWGGGFCLQEIDTPLASVSWSSQALTFSFNVNGSGTLVLDCSSRGVPVEVSGMTAAYNSATAILTGLYSGVSAVTVDWGQSQGTGGTGSGGPGGSSGSGTVSVTLGQGAFGTVTAGTNQTATLMFAFSGTSFTVTSVTFTGNGAQYVVASGLPSTFFGGQGSITVELNVPAGASAGSYSLGVSLTGLDAYGTQHVSSGQATFTVEAPAETPGFSGSIGMPSGWVQFVIVVAVISCVVIGALAVMTRRRT